MGPLSLSLALSGEAAGGAHASGLHSDFKANIGGLVCCAFGGSCMQWVFRSFSPFVSRPLRAALD